MCYLYCVQCTDCELIAFKQVIGYVIRYVKNVADVLTE